MKIHGRAKSMNDLEDTKLSFEMILLLHIQQYKKSTWLGKKSQKITRTFFNNNNSFLQAPKEKIEPYASMQKK